MQWFGKDARHPVSVTLNAKVRSALAEPRMLLSDFLRYELGATGIHVGCEHGVCGACTVLIDGAASRSCLMLAVQADGRRIDTVEGLGGEQGELNDLQRAFRRNFALQCGYCTPGILMSASEFLEQVSNPTEAEVRSMLAGHLCRCTGYTKIVQAIVEVAAARTRAAFERDDHRD